jgi:hypothetical protein
MSAGVLHVQLVSIEPTPNPNSMKLNLDESLPAGSSRTYTSEDRQDCPDYIARLLDVQGVKSLFHMAGFIAVQRVPRCDWQGILAAIRRAFGPGGEDAAEPAVRDPDATFGEVQVEVQMFRDIPMLVKVSAGTEVLRQALPERFAAAVNRAAPASPNMLAERRWMDQGARYGDLKQIAQEVVEEIAAAYDDRRVDQLVRQAFVARAPAGGARPPAAPMTRLPEDPDWRVRYAALEAVGPRPDAIPVFVQALHDPQSSIRRLAAVYLGLTGDPAAVPPLCEALADDTVSVRRTAGDSLSDLADRRAIGPMTKALEDQSKLVRWRAARFLYETGDESALPALRQREDDPEFEVRMQVRLAIERIEGGGSGRGPVWQQMTR